MTRTVLLDFESRSEADLETVGGRIYWQHPSTEAICCVIHVVDTNERIVWLPGDPCPVAPDDLLVAHNMTGFDRFGCVALGWRSTPMFPYVDSSELARSAGLPGSLDELAQRWLGREKDHAGNAVVKRLSGIESPLRKTEKGVTRPDGSIVWGLEPKEIRAAVLEWYGWTLPKTIKPDGERIHVRTLWEVSEHVVRALKSYRGVGHPIPLEVYRFVIEYCSNDVDVMVDAWPRLLEWIDADLPGVRDFDREINERGVRFDVDLARALLREDERGKREAAEAMARDFDATPEELIAAANSPAQFCAITGAPNAQAPTVKEIDHPLARLRERLASIASGKLTTALESLSPDGRLRDVLRYHAAHTGRWAGARFQPQNLPRPDKRFESWGDAEVCALADSAIAGGRLEQDEIDLLVRACLVSDDGEVLVWGDFSAVEGRGLAWAAGDHAALDVYRQGRDPYKVAATAIYSVDYDAVTKAQRQIGKVAELALGYGGGKNAFARMAAAYGVDVSALDVQGIVDAWRAGRAPTQAWWRALQNAMVEAYMTGQPCAAGDFVTFVPGGDGSVAMVLPSGRAVMYWGVQVEPGNFGPSISYEGAYSREHIYGGKLAENAVQAFCRDLLVAAIVRIIMAGYRIVLTVHDEVVLTVPRAKLAEAIAFVREALSAPPDWAPGLILEGSVEHGERYRK